MAEITEADKRRIASHLLSDPVVRDTLAGFLHQELRHIHNALVEPPEIARALAKYVAGIDQMLDEAIAAHRAGMRPRGW